MTNRTIILIFVVLVLGLVSYVFWQRQAAPSVKEGAPEVAEIPVVAALERVKTIQLNTELFQSALFRSLKPLPPNPTPEAAPGRENPYIPF